MIDGQVRSVGSPGPTDGLPADYPSGSRQKHSIATAYGLSVRCATLARLLREHFLVKSADKSEHNPAARLLAKLESALATKIDHPSVADAYAQTVVCSLVTLYLANPGSSVSNLSATGASTTNPFLCELLQGLLPCRNNDAKADTSLDLTDLGLSDLVDLLDRVDADAVAQNFKSTNPHHDLFTGFYESFLIHYDVNERVRRGVYCTPRPIVSAIVRAVDHTLTEHFKLEDGLADTSTWAEMAARHAGLGVPSGINPDQPFVQILDPAVGTGTFLIEVIEVIHQRMLGKWKIQGYKEDRVNQLWSQYVASNLLPRLHGIELLPAPCFIAHLAVELKLRQTGYMFRGSERIQIFAGNALHRADTSLLESRLPVQLPGASLETGTNTGLHRGITVVVGNPPYKSASQNIGPEFSHTVERFRWYGGGRIRERGAVRFEHAINNDYVKFWGLSLQLLKTAEFGVACMITPNTFLTAKSFRGLREAMLEIGDGIEVWSLSQEGAQRPGKGRKDQKLFHIMSQLAITQVARTPSVSNESRLRYVGCATLAHQKLKLLADVEKQDFDLIEPSKSNYLAFAPTSRDRHSEYSAFPQAHTIFPWSVDGIKTSRDGLVIGNSREECRDKILCFSEMEDIAAAREKFRIKSPAFDVRAAQRYVAETFDESCIKPFCYRPFDTRYIYYDRNLISSDRMNIMPAILEPGSLALVFASKLSRRGFDHVMATDALCSHKLASHDVNSRMFPVIGGDIVRGKCGLRSYVNPEILKIFDEPDASTIEEQSRAFGAYVYAVCNATGYRQRYEAEIWHEFPRIPLPKTKELSLTLSAIGAKLFDAHLLRDDVPDDAFVFDGLVGDMIETPWRDGDAIWLGKSARFRGMNDQIGNFEVCGYRVCSSWFTAGGRSGLQRRGRLITPAVISSFRRVLWAIHETIVLRPQIDAAIEQHGGWPEAFCSSSRPEISRIFSQDSRKRGRKKRAFQRSGPAG